MAETVIEIELNGASHAIAAHLTLEALIEQLQLSGKSLAVAINREIVPRGMWKERALQASDRVEVVRAIGGG